MSYVYAVSLAPFFQSISWVDALCIGYVLCINVYAFCLTAVDKHRAVHQKWRIPEHTFFLLALFGGAFGIWFGMGVFHHKTKKKRFIGVIVPLLLLQILVLVAYLSRFR